METINNAALAPVAPAMNAFFTREAANEGVQLPLYLPSGEKSEHWVRILGVDSDAFRYAESESRRDTFRLAAIEDLAARSEEIASSKRRLIASLVVAWSFPQECTLANVDAFFREAPQIMDAIDITASKRALFFAGRSSGSQNLPSTSSSLT